jgi:dipeptidase D
MVCQKNTDSTHDFLRDPIQVKIRDGWLVAPDTTLGADNGIGASLALAVLDTPGLEHPPLEVLLTVNEESGMTGAHGLADDALQGELILNLDTEEWGEFCLGSAGGVEVNIACSYEQETLPNHYALYAIELGGLRGGHSGMDIHLERGNAIKLIVRLLNSLRSRFGNALRLVSLESGSARNAIPHEARAIIGLEADIAAQMANRIAGFATTLKTELAGADEAVHARFAPLPRALDEIHVMALADQHRLLAAAHAAPHGVHRMSQRISDTVETSNNFGILRIANGRVSANFMVRSLLESSMYALCAEIESLFRLASAQVGIEGHYPSWAPNPNSHLLAFAQETYKRLFGNWAKEKVIHAGLECGILSAKYPQADILSFGPDICGAHAPGECVNIETVARVWQLLTEILKTIPAKS